MGDQAYSFSLTTFSRTGKLLPIEYALNAVANGRSALGICAVDGVVLATDKKMPSVLVDCDNVHKIELINDTAGCCFAGVGPDYRVLGKSRIGVPQSNEDDRLCMTRPTASSSHKRIVVVVAVWLLFCLSQTSSQRSGDVPINVR
jgi:Proteasome subunit